MELEKHGMKMGLCKKNKNLKMACLLAYGIHGTKMEL